MTEMDIKSETVFIEPKKYMRNNYEGVCDMDMSIKTQEKNSQNNEIEEFCKKILRIDGFKNLLDDQTLNLKDRTSNLLLDDLNLRNVINVNNRELEIQIEDLEMIIDSYEKNTKK